jgi:electron transfer flavoprotein alpha/beta subunit
MVKIIVLVKQVVQSAELKVDRTTKTLVTQGVPQVIRVGLSGQKS